MSKNKIENNDLEKISSGVSEAANGLFWLTNDEVTILKNKGYNVSINWILAKTDGDRTTHKVTINGNPATLKELQKILNG